MMKKERRLPENNLVALFCQKTNLGRPIEILEERMCLEHPPPLSPHYLAEDNMSLFFHRVYAMGS